MSGETDPNHHFCPPLREPVSAPTPRSDLTNTETRVIETFCRAITPMTVTRGLYMGGECVLFTEYGAHKQQVRGTTLLAALANVQRLYDDIHAAPAAEAA